MSRNLSAAAVQSLFASQTNEVWLMLIEITHADITDIQVTSNTVETVHNGVTYYPYPFEITLPDDVPNTMPPLNLVIDNVDRLLVDTIRSVTGSPKVTLKFVLADTPDDIEAGPFEFHFLNAVYDQLKITGTLIYQDIVHEPFPAGRYTPELFPALF